MNPRYEAVLRKQLDGQHERNSTGLHVDGFCRVCAELHEALFSVALWDLLREGVSDD